MRDQIECKSCEMKFPFPNFYIQHHQNVHGNLPPDYDDKGNLLRGIHTVISEYFNIKEY